MTLPDNRRLAGRRIVVTRALEQSEELLDRLRDAGAEPLSLPMVRFLEPTDFTALDQAIASLGEFDWLILTSANAVRFFLTRCRALDRWPLGDKPRIAAVGPATQAALEAAGLRAAFVPRTFNGSALAAELAPHLPGRRALLPRSDRAADDLPAALRAAGTDVTEVIAYRTAAPERLDDALIGMICHGQVDAVIFFSPSAVQQFAGAVGAETFAQIGARSALVAVGPVTASAIRKARAIPAVEAPRATSGGVVEALERYFVYVGSKYRPHPRAAGGGKREVLMAFPVQRARRLRRSAAIRGMVRETRLTTSGFVYPMFVCPGSGVRKEVSSMPGVCQQSPDKLVEECREVEGLGIPAVMLFGLPEHKDELGSEAWSPTGAVQRAIEAIRSAKLKLVVITDVCLCEYTSHGHCGVIENGEVANDPTLKLLAEESLSHARAGADIIAPSDMMDGRVAAIRAALDAHNFAELPILSYAAKYCSGFYGPFREAADSTPQFGDRGGYQMDPANSREALREVALDLEEGADMVMVKPALPYLDVIRQVRDRFDVPVAAYNVSGEYAMVKAAARNGWLDEKRVTLEVLTSIQRAGAEIIMTYHAKDVARWLKA